MKKAYYYFLYSIYMYYKKKEHESDSEALLSTTIVSTTCVSINILTVFMVLIYNNLLPSKLLESSILLILCVCLLGYLNYVFFVKEKTFLNPIFATYKKNWLVIVYMVISLTLTIGMGYINRQKVYSEKPPLPEHLRKESLEGRIRDWIRDL